MCLRRGKSTLWHPKCSHVPSAVIHSSFMQAAGKPDPSPRRSEESTPPSGLKASVT